MKGIDSLDFMERPCSCNMLLMVNVGKVAKCSSNNSANLDRSTWNLLVTTATSCTPWASRIGFVITAFSRVDLDFSSTMMFSSGTPLLTSDFLRAFAWASELPVWIRLLLALNIMKRLTRYEKFSPSQLTGEWKHKPRDPKCALTWNMVSSTDDQRIEFLVLLIELETSCYSLLEHTACCSWRREALHSVRSWEVLQSFSGVMFSDVLFTRFCETKTLCLFAPATAA